MSAWIVDKAHIDLMVKAITEGTRDGAYAGRTCGRDALGQLLVSENVASIAYRYPDEPHWQECGYGRPYRYRDPVYRPTAAELFKAVSCYDYQSCEHPGWGGCAMNKLCGLIRAEIRRAVPGVGRSPEYEAAPWGFSPDEIGLLWAETTEQGRTLLAHAADTGETYALSDYLMENGLTDAPLDVWPQRLVRYKPAPPTAGPVDRDEAIKRIKAALKRRSGKAWSVTGGRGTAWGWITIDAPPARRTWRWVQTTTPDRPHPEAAYRGVGGITPAYHVAPGAAEPILSPEDDPWAREAAGHYPLHYDWECPAPAGYEFGHASPADRLELAKLLGLDNLHFQGASVSPDERTFYVDRAENRAAEVARRQPA